MELHYFLTTNGSLGRASFLEGELAQYRDIIRLEGYPRSLAASLIRECYAAAKQNHIDMEILHNCLDNSPEGVLFPALGTGIVNIPVYEARFDLLSLFKNEHLDIYGKQIQRAYNSFRDALLIHDEWEKVYMQSTDYDALNRLTEDTAAMLLADHKTDYPGTLYDRFFGSATINGSFDYIDILSADTKRYFIKGRPGTGKSTFLKKIALSAHDRGFHVERYHCSFDPNSLDMVIIRELKICIFDSTAPHEYFPTLENDEIIDMYQVAVKPDTDEKFQKVLLKISQSYKKKIDEATKFLIAANEACNKAEAQYRTYIDDDRLMLVRKAVMQRIFP